MMESFSWRPAGLAARSLLWMVLLPGVVAGYVPWRYFGLRHVRWDHPGLAQLAGWAGFGAGVLLLIACVWELPGADEGPCPRWIHPGSWWSGASIAMSGTRCTWRFR